MKSLWTFTSLIIITATASGEGHYAGQLRGFQRSSLQKRVSLENNIPPSPDLSKIPSHRTMEDLNSTIVNSIIPSTPNNPTNVFQQLPTMEPTLMPATATPKVDEMPPIDRIASPTTNSTTVPTKVPINIATVSPTELVTNAPTLRPTMLQSDIPTNFPSNPPSISPTRSPSNTPSQLPTKTPSNTPTLLPSKAPTETPTTPPTKFPSKIPTDSPKNLLTFSPTKVSTNSDTTDPDRIKLDSSCHDLDSYTSPINENLTCSHHKGTDCRKWIAFDAMNATTVIDLLQSCPVSCNVPCGNHLYNLSTTIENVWNSLELDTGNEGRESKERSDMNATSLILSSMVVISIVGVGIGCIIRKREDWILFTDLTPKNNEKGIHERQIIESPFAGSSSDEGSGEAGSPSVDHSFLSRVLYSQSQESDENPSSLLSRIGETFNTTMRNFEPNDGMEEEEISPLSPANIIPPMIVINNIEEDEVPLSSREVDIDENDQTTNLNYENQEIREELEKNGIQVKRIEASSALAAALSSQRMDNPLPAYNLLCPLQSRSAEDIDVDGLEISPHSLISARPSIGETASAVSTPSTVHPQDAFDSKESKHNKENNVFSFATENEMEPEDDFTVLFEKSMIDGDKSSRTFRLRGLFQKQKKIDSMSIEDERFDQDSHYESDANASDISTVLRERDRREDLQLSSPQSSGISDSNRDEDDDDDSTFSLYKHNFDSQDGADSIEIIEGSSTRHIRHLSHSSMSISHHRSMSDGTWCPSSKDSGYFYTFLAPCYGKLGITIETKASTWGPIIHQVKDYSPLFGMVQPGNKIIAIDGEDTSYMDTRLLTDLLSRRRFESKSRDEKINITVLSREKKSGFAAEKEIDIEGRDDINQSSMKSNGTDFKEIDEYDQFDTNDHFLATATASGDEGDCHLMAGGDEEYM